MAIYLLASNPDLGIRLVTEVLKKEEWPEVLKPAAYLIARQLTFQQCLDYLRLLKVRLLHQSLFCTEQIWRLFEVGFYNKNRMDGCIGVVYGGGLLEGKARRGIRRETSSQSGERQSQGGCVDCLWQAKGCVFGRSS